MKKMRKKALVLWAVFVFLWAIPANASLEQDIKGQQLRFFSPVTIQAHEVVKGDVVSFFSHVEIHGQVTGDVVGIFSQIHMNKSRVEGDVISILKPITMQQSQVKGDVVSVLGGIDGSENSKIHGDAIAILGHGLELEDTKVVGSHIDVLGGIPANISGLGLLAGLMAFLFVIKQGIAFVLGVIALVLFPERFERMASVAFDDIGRKTLVGLLVYGGGWVLLVILVVSVMGAPLIPILIPSFMLLEFGANTTVKIAFGRRMVRSIGKEWGSIAALFLGTLLFIVLEITIVGKVFTFLFKLIGLGQIVDSRFGDFTLTEGKGGTHGSTT